jgi:hypothetical protein
MIGKCSQADRLLVVGLPGGAQHHVQWRDLTEAGHAAAVKELRRLAAGRADLLAEVADALEGSSEGQLNEPLKRQAARLCRDAGADPVAIPAWIGGRAATARGGGASAVQPAAAAKTARPRSRPHP